MNIMEFNSLQSYSLGLLWADGYLNKPSKQMYLEVVSEDFFCFLPFIESLGELVYRSRKREGRREQTYCYFRDKEMNNWCINNRFAEKSLISPCGFLNCMSKKNIVSFLLGWVDGDGCFYVNEKNKCYQFTMAGSHDQDWKALEEILIHNDINYTLSRRVNKMNQGQSSLRITGKKNLVKFIFLVYSSSDVKFGLPRKKEKAIKILKRFLHVYYY
jgi:hypothetical protein